MTIQHRNFINGRFIETQAQSMIPVLNPATGQVLSEIPETSAEMVDDAVTAAKRAQKSWEAKAPIERAGHLRQISEKIRENVPALAKTIVAEQGKTMGLAEIEVNFTADYIDYMAEWARRLEGEIVTSDNPKENIFLFRQAIGIVGGILPWNFPFFLIARKLAPALLTGNTIVLKPSEETPNNAAMFMDLLAETDMPVGVVNMVYGKGAGAGAALCENPDVGLLSFTGSVETGSRIMAAAAKNITKVNLELGGKAPAIVLKDADLDLAVDAIVASRVINSGQVCNCAERVYVEADIEEAFIDKLAKKMSEQKFGNPAEDFSVAYGPMINKAGLDKVSAMVDRAKAAGATVVTGGEIAELGQGHYYQPTVLTGCAQDSEIIQKEVFGPVLPVNTVCDIDEAITRANDSDYGLTSSIYTRDLNAAMQASRELKFGETYINRNNFEAMQGYHAGMRKSGIGGADGKHGLYEFTETHMVYIQS